MHRHWVSRLFHHSTFNIVEECGKLPVHFSKAAPCPTSISNPITLELLDHQLQRVQDHINAFEQTISLQLKAMDARLDQMDAKLKLIDVRLDQQDLKFQRVEERLDAIANRLVQLAADIKS